jgi:hypothetical protein
MNLTVLIYVEGRKAGGRATTYRARPLFFDVPTLAGDKLERLLSRLAHDIGQMLSVVGREACQDSLAAWTFFPALGQHRLEEGGTSPAPRPSSC